eukprot:7123331-Lingulodinium_polyedra.AAC.1
MVPDTLLEADVDEHEQTLVPHLIVPSSRGHPREPTAQCHFGTLGSILLWHTQRGQNGELVR